MKKTVRNIVILLAVLLVLGGTAYLLMNLPKDGDGEESSQPSSSAPLAITSREQPAANFLSLNFFFTDFTSKSDTLLEGRISAAAPIRPVSSSHANSTFSISCSGSTSEHIP